jgi:hypothetical protein
MKKRNLFCLLVVAIFVFSCFLGACDVEKVDSTVTPTVDNNAGYLTTQTLNDVFLDLGENDTEGDIFWKDGTKVLSKGENQYEWAFTPANQTRFNSASGKVAVVAYDSLEDATVSMSNWTYGDSSSTPSVSSNTGNGQVNYCYAELGDNFYFETKPVDAGQYVIKAQIEKTDDYAGKDILSTFTIDKKTLTEDMSSDIQNVIYSGSSQTPTVVLKNLTADKDYTVSWEYKSKDDADFGALADDFVSVGTYQATISGKGNYTGEITKEFQIFAETTENKELVENQETQASEQKSSSEENSSSDKNTDVLTDSSAKDTTENDEIETSKTEDTASTSTANEASKTDEDVDEKSTNEDAKADDEKSETNEENENINDLEDEKDEDSKSDAEE